MGRQVERLFQVVGTKAQVPRLRGKTVRGMSSETTAQSRKAGGERGGEGGERGEDWSRREGNTERMQIMSRENGIIFQVGKMT